MKRTGLILGFILGIILGSQSSNAQFAVDFQTNIISGVTSNWTGDYIVGSNTFADALLIQLSGVLSNGVGWLGYELNSSNNTAFVADGGSVWNCGVLIVGRGGSGNSLIVSHGGRVFNGDAQLGNQSSSSNNSVLVTGSASFWSNGFFLSVGYAGSGNSLIISNGGKVISSLTEVGSGADNNSALVTGSGSVWSNSSFLDIGNAGAGNTLTIAAGGRVLSTGGGSIGDATNGNNNIALVTDAGSAWNNLGPLSVGHGGSGNRLIIIKGGQVSSFMPPPGGASGFVGLSAGSSNNSVLVSDTNSVWNNFSTLIIGSSGAGNSLVISNGGKVLNGFGYVGYNGSSTNNSVVVSGSGSVWTNQSVFIGSQGAGNTLLITNGAQVIDGSASNVKLGGFIGESASSSSNTAVVTGTGSLWKNLGGVFDAAGGLTVGDLGAWNRLIISDGASVLGTRGVIGLASSSNTVRVIEEGAWQVDGLIVGRDGSSNSLVIADGFVSATTNVLIGAASAGCDNLIQLDSGSVIVTNATHDAVLEVRQGKLILNGGTLQVDRFVMTNACAQFVRTGGTLIYGTAVLDPNRDDDGDGIPNGWEQSHGRDPLNAADVNADTDGDGQSDLAEFQAGTDPTNSASAFRIIEIAPDGDDIMLTWATVGGKKYAVQFLDGSYTNDFIEFEPIFIAPGTGESTFSVIDPGATTNASGRFYRIRLVQ
jgi:T5SS/PEP-CTERM-associated repeat protein